MAIKPRHLLSIDDLSKEDILQILDKAAHLSRQDQDSLKNKTVINLFFEASTRTRISFELAAKRLGADVVNFLDMASSTQKGETALDTFLTVQAMHSDIVVVRHRENGIPELFAKHALPHLSVINAGDGTNEHPTQALLDMLTIQQKKKNFSELSVAIVGDVANSRVAQSDIKALQKLEVRDIRVVGPDYFLKNDWIQHSGVSLFQDMKLGLKDVDVVLMLRIQKERLQHHLSDQEQKEFIQHFCLDANKLAIANKDVIVMHPGPMNRGVEISSDIADGKHSVIFQQVSNGVLARMAVMLFLQGI